MKQKILVIITLAFIGLSTTYGQVGVGTNSPDASAALEVQSTEKGFLPPRMSTLERDGISLPEEGLVIYNLTENHLEFFNGTHWISIVSGLITSGPCQGEPTTITFLGLEYSHVESSGKCWFDRNLGASQVATSSTDEAAYGDLYQWGRSADGHQIRTSSTTSTRSNTDIPGNGNFITNSSTTNDWRDPQNNSLWQGVNGTNNPCPTNYRLPNELEWNNERISWSPVNPDGAFASPLKLPVAGLRRSNDGLPLVVGAEGHYWSSTVDQSPSTTARRVRFGTNLTSMHSGNRASGYSVRCLKD
jgi:hypothetical protein